MNRKIVRKDGGIVMQGFCIYVVVLAICGEYLTFTLTWLKGTKEKVLGAKAAKVEGARAADTKVGTPASELVHCSSGIKVINYNLRCFQFTYFNVSNQSSRC